MSSLEDVLTEWQTNLYFKEEFKKNPERALATAGLTLNSKDLKKVKAMLAIQDDASGSDNRELDKRINR
jgi:hypothetical protein